MKKVIYFLTLAIIIALLAAALFHSNFYRENQKSLSGAISFSGALQWVIAGGYFLTFVGMFMFGPIIISAAAFAAALGYFNVWIIFAIAVFGELAIDLVLYVIGYFSRIAVVEKYSRVFGMPENTIEKLEQLIHLHPGKTLTAIKLAPILPVPGLMLVGSTHMPVKKFASINFLIALIRAAIFMVIGYYFGQIYDSVSGYVKNIGYAIGVLAIISVAAYYIYKKTMNKISDKLEKV